jgi:hypothetical protein
MSRGMKYGTASAQLLEEAKKINPNNVFLWIDVQGYEGFVLDGGRETLRYNPPLVMEFWPYALERSGCIELLKEIIIKANYN